MVNILVLGAGGNVSQGIISAVKLSNIPCRIVGACVSAESLGLYFCDAAYISPYANDPGFIDWVVSVCNKEEIDIILTGVEENILALALAKESVEARTKAVFISSGVEQLRTGLSKIGSARWLEANDCNFPKSADVNDEEAVDGLVDAVGFPLIAKPNSGKGSSGIVLAHSKEDLGGLAGKDYCVQEYLGSGQDEYTVGCYTDRKGELCGMIIMHRMLKHGTTFMAEVVENDAIRRECEKICTAFKPTGPLNIQLRLHHGVPVCFELNVRFSGTTPIRARLGFNDVEAMIREYVDGEDPRRYLFPVRSGKVYRYYNEAYIDVDMQKRLESDGVVKDCHKYHSFVEIK